MKATNVTKGHPKVVTYALLYIHFIVNAEVQLISC